MEKLKENPALVIGMLMTLLAAVMEVIDLVAQNKSLGVLAIVKMALPVIAGALIRTRVLSVEWVTKVLTQGRGALNEGQVALDAIAEQVKVAPPAL